MNRIFIFLATLLLAGVASFAQNTATLSGTVRLAGEDTVLHDASVQIVELKRTTTTDNSGAYRFAGVPAGTYTITVHQEGFADSSKKVTVAAGTPATADFALTITGLKEQVTITATGSEQSTFDSIATVHTVDSTQIISRSAVGVGDVPSNEAGLANRLSGRGSSRTVVLGFGGDKSAGRKAGLGWVVVRPDRRVAEEFVVGAQTERSRHGVGRRRAAAA